MFITSASNSNCGINNIGANFLPEIFFSICEQKAERGWQKSIKVWLEWYGDLFTWTLCYNVNVTTMFHCCLECQTMPKKILDPQYMMLLNQVKQDVLIFAKAIPENLDQTLVMTKWSLTTWYTYLNNKY